MNDLELLRPILWTIGVGLAVILLAIVAGKVARRGEVEPDPWSQVVNRTTKAYIQEREANLLRSRELFQDILDAKAREDGYPDGPIVTVKPDMPEGILVRSAEYGCGDMVTIGKLVRLDDVLDCYRRDPDGKVTRRWFTVDGATIIVDDPDGISDSAWEFMTRRFRKAVEMRKEDRA